MIDRKNNDQTTEQVISMNKSNLPKSIPLAAAALLGLSAFANAATTLASADATISSANFVNAGGSGQTGRNGANNADFRAFAVFSVSSILANESLALGDLSTKKFELTFDTIGSPSVLLSAGSYKVDYLGFFANSDFPNTGALTGLGNWSNKYSATSLGTIDTGVADTLGLQSDISASGFTLTGVTEANSANDVVLFRVLYNEPQSTGVNETLSGYTLTAIPEPSAALLGGLGLLALLRRRR
jgi:hypothetical protein